MNRFSQYPFVRILIPFILGILFQVYVFEVNILIQVLFLAGFLLYVLDLFFIRQFDKYEYRLFNGIYVSLLFFLFGSIWTSLNDESKDIHHYGAWVKNDSYSIVELMGDPQQKEKSFKLKVKVVAVKKDGDWVKTKGIAFLYLQKDSLAEKLGYGDRLLLHSAYKEIPGPMNPNEFNYRQYCFFNKIYFQSYAVAGQWKKIEEQGNAVVKFASRSRKYLLGVLKNCGLEDQEFAVASALILGYTDEINAETKTAYSSSGALHVLAVSGLHVAIIYALLDKILLFLLFFKNGKYGKALLVLSLLWLYALVTGLSPSVVRAATMLSTIIIAKTINRHANIYNTIAASAFILLCFDPFFLMEVGFQLSYLAVIGIIYLQPRIYQWFYFKNRIIDFIWNISSVSLAAQVATFPLGILYFHQFPNYFLISNLIVIPLGTIILYTGILMLIFYPVKGLGEILTYLLKFLVHTLNSCVAWVEQIPFSLTSGFAISVFECYLIYGIILGILLYFNERKVFFLKLTFLLTSFLFINFTWTRIAQKKQNLVIVYKVKNHSAIDLVKGTDNLFLTDTGLMNNQSKMLFHVHHNWHSLGIEHTDYQNRVGDFDKNKDYFFYHNFLAQNDFRIFKIDSNFEFVPAKQKLKLDLIIISNNTKVSYDQLNSLFYFDCVVFDATNSNYSVRKFMKEAGKRVKVYSVNESGAFVKTI